MLTMKATQTKRKQMKLLCSDFATKQSVQAQTTQKFDMILVQLMLTE